MITHIATAVIYVSDQDQAMAFYRDILGFDVVQDVAMGPEGRWLEVAPAHGTTSIMLASASAFGKQPGEGAHLTFATDDVSATAKALKARGAQVSEVTTAPWGTYATVAAPDGHDLQFNERHIK